MAIEVGLLTDATVQRMSVRVQIDNKFQEAKGEKH